MTTAEVILTVKPVWGCMAGEGKGVASQHEGNQDLHLPRTHCQHCLYSLPPYKTLLRVGNTPCPRCWHQQVMGVAFEPSSLNPGSFHSCPLNPRLREGHLYPLGF
jgi:hypothetical protein